jgi:hypothetical protein
VGHETHIGLVDAHAEGDGGHHHHTLVAQEAVLVVLAHPGVEPGVVGQGVHAVLAQGLGDLLHPLARLAIHHTGVTLVFALDEPQQLGRGVLLLDDGVADVGPVETADEGAGVLQLQALEDVLAGQGIGGGGEPHARHRRITLVQHRECAVLGAEVVAPLADAMHLVDGEQAQFAALDHGVELGQETRRGDPFGRGIDQCQLAAHHLALDLRGLVG